MVSGAVFSPSLALVRVRHVVILLAIAIAGVSPAHAAELDSRAAWVPASALDSSDTIRRAINAAVAAGVQAIVAPVPLYPEPGPDHFAELLKQARDRQLRVYASIDLDRAALAGELPASRDHVLYQHPDWLMVPRGLAPEVLSLDVRSPEYVGRLIRWTRTNNVDGIYLSPLLDDVVGFVVSNVTNVLKRYAVDGVELDAARYPADNFDYGRRAVEAFRRELRPTLTAADRARVDEDEAIDPFAYPNAFPEAWRLFRQSRVTGLVSKVRAAIRQIRPDTTVVAAISGAADTDLMDHLQDWRSWLTTRLVDAVSLRTGSLTRILSDLTLVAPSVNTTARSESR